MFYGKSNTFVEQRVMVMNSNEQALTAFQTRVRQMLLRFQQLKKENDELYTMLEQNEKDIEDLRKKLEQKKNDYRKKSGKRNICRIYRFTDKGKHT